MNKTKKKTRTVDPLFFHCRLDFIKKRQKIFA